MQSWNSLAKFERTSLSRLSYDMEAIMEKYGMRNATNISNTSTDSANETTYDTKKVKTLNCSDEIDGKCIIDEQDNNIKVERNLDVVMDELDALGREIEFRSSFYKESNSFCDSMIDIPILPSGKTLTIQIRSTWGDPYYVGMTGIECFDEEGRLIQLDSPLEDVVAVPHSINVLPEYDNDPRTCDKLVDGVNFTMDDMHVWLAPWMPESGETTITLYFRRTVTLSMMRFWNLNKNRIHSYRGIVNHYFIL